MMPLEPDAETEPGDELHRALKQIGMLRQMMRKPQVEKPAPRPRLRVIEGGKQQDG